MEMNEMVEEVRIEITEHDVEQFNELVNGDGEPFTWELGSTSVTFVTEGLIVGRCEVCEDILLEGDEDMIVDNFQHTYNAVFCGQMHYEAFVKKWIANARDD